MLGRLAPASRFMAMMKRLRCKGWIDLDWPRLHGLATIQKLTSKLWAAAIESPTHWTSHCSRVPVELAVPTAGSQ